MSSKPRDPDEPIETPTSIDPLPAPPVIPRGPGTLQMISMKDPTADAAARPALPVKPIHVQLRTMAEATGRRYPTPPGGLGYLAPPREAPSSPRSPRWLRALGLGLGGLALAAAIATAIWFLA